MIELYRPEWKQNKTKTILYAVGFVCLFTLLLVLFSQLKAIVPPALERYAHGVVGMLAAFTTTWLFLRYEGKTFRQIGLNWEAGTIKRFLAGTVAGCIISAAMVFLQVVFSGLKIEPVDSTAIPVFILWSFALLPLAFMEEIAFRGYPFIKLTEACGIRITQLTIAILFGLYHVTNGWPVWLAFLGPAIWSLAFGLASLLSQGIAAPTGLHVGVNYVLALIGSQKGIPALWTIDFPGNASEEMLAANERFGYTIQLVLLAICILVTEWLIRSRYKAIKMGNP
ncbi:type II CAAX endopeptidase family protein [Pontibacter sp. H259]|uniref:CPBP family intramembrane glutamic endopeptidase n=1 Tax=Pontibacter sp. H259 TaxID=3133421 RepID=UPI0030C1C5C7